MQQKNLEKLAKLIRYYSLVSTTEAGSGHPTSSLSAADLMATLMFGGFFHADIDDPKNLNNDRLIFSKGHASPLLYSLYAAAGKISEKELLTLRKLESRLEGHPTMRFPFTEAATGSLGQGLSIGVGMALNAKLDKLSYKTYVLLGDSEMAEGSVWEAIQIAMYYKLDNLIGILDVNRLGQRGETMYGHKVQAYVKRISAFGWQTYAIDGHDLKEISKAFDRAMRVKGRPTMIIAKTIKGKGVKIFENKDGWHGKALTADQLQMALKELGEIDKDIHGELLKPKSAEISNSQFSISKQIQNSNSKNVSSFTFQVSESYATRKAYGEALVRIAEKYPQIVVLDAEVSNSTFAEIFQKAYPKRFFEMYIAEQNMVGAAAGLARRGKIPFVSTFAAFFTRAYDQIRMAQYSDSNIKFCGSHAGVSIGEDGPSQMGLEDIAMFRTLLDGVVLYPCDAVSTHALVEEAAKHKGNVYIRTTRALTPVIYDPHFISPPHEGESERGSGITTEFIAHNFRIGGSCVIRQSPNDSITIVSAGITLHEALAAHEEMKKEGVNLRVIDLYSIKPIDSATLAKAAHETQAIITVEDHFAEGGIGEAVRSALDYFPSPSAFAKALVDRHPSPDSARAHGRVAQRGEGESKKVLLSPTGRGQGEGGDVRARVYSLAVRKMPQSGKPQELLNYEEISKDAIINKVKEILKLNLSIQ